MLDFTEYTKIFISLFAILDPIGIIPIIILLTAGMGAQKRARIGLVASVTVGSILLVALFVGQPMLAFFGISINSFRVAGGILLLLMSIRMLNGNLSTPVSVKGKQILNSPSEVTALESMCPAEKE